MTAPAVADHVAGEIRDSVDELRNLPNQFIPTARTDLRAGKRLDLGLGFNTEIKAGQRLAIEYVLPLHQDLDGPQLKSEGMFTIGYQYSL